MRIVLAALFSGLLFLGVWSFMSVGWRLGRARLHSGGDDAFAGLGALEAAVYGLMGLLVAFTFTGAAERFEQRRDLVTQEINAIGTAWLRLDLLDTQARNDMRSLLRQYLEARIETYADIRDRAAPAASMKKSVELQNAIWNRLAAAAQQDQTSRVAAAVLPAVNQMFDLANTRTLATQRHPPLAIYLALGFLALVSALLAGFGMARAPSFSALHAIGFAAIVSATIYLILDLEFPRLGLLRVDDFDPAFAQLRQSMETPPWKDSSQ